MRIEEGRLLKRSCPDCGNLEWRAFGDVESARGELASYAFGWALAHEDAKGRLTIGIGAGRPGGGSFHADVRVGQDRLGLALVDEPFEDVPQGGPHLSRAEALAHVDVDFVWSVADQVMAQDRRAWWMEHWLRATRAFATTPVVDGTAPVRHVVRDDDEQADWQLLCSTAEKIHLFHLHHALDRDQTLLEILDLEPGQRADRKGPRRRWKRSRLR
jgi:hypothetical protein